jgi:hypothetical protein
VPDKYEREIEEILRRSSFSAPRGNRNTSSWLAGLGANWQWPLADLSPTRLLTYGLVLAVVGYFMRSFAPELGAPLSLLALVLLLAGLVMSITRRSAQRPKGWRGRLFESPSQTADIWESLLRRWQNWRRGRGWNDSRRP